MIRVLIADDQALVRSGLAALLSLESDLEVVAQAANGREAVDLAVSTQVDVALLDVQMPELDGIAAARELSKRAPGCKTLIVTTFGRTGYLRSALEAGASGFMVKDTPAEQLAQAIRRVHEGFKVVDPELAAASFSEGASPLTERETQVLSVARDGSEVAVIAAQLHLSQGTVRNHLSSAITKTGASNRFQAATIAFNRGWI